MVEPSGMNVSPTSLYIYVRNQRVSQVSHLPDLMLLDWLSRLDGEYVTELVLMNEQGWLTIEPYNDALMLCLCNNGLEICLNEVVSREAAKDKVLQFVRSNEPI